MDPLTCLGLVSSIVQLIDAAANAVTLCHEVYTRGASIEDSQMRYTSDQLRQCYSVLDNSLKPSVTGGLKASSSGVDLSDLVSQCCATAKSLHTELQSLGTLPKEGLRKTAYYFYSKKRKSKSINNLKSRLDEYQRVLDSKILVDIKQWLGTLEVQFEGQYSNLEQQLSQLSANLATCHIPFSNQLQSELENAVNVNEQQHILTRQHAEAQISSAVQSLEILQEKHRSEGKMELLHQQQHERFVASLTFDEINLRMNEVSSSHPQTFGWIFDDNIDSPWDSFVEWLRGDECIYWIQGKAGSGKSTFMKYLADDSRTSQLLAQWSLNLEVLIVKHFFWLSGSKVQRSFKGLVCSIARSIVLGDKCLVEKLVARDETLLMKRNVHDWSGPEIRRLLGLVTSLMTRPICVFIDGLDEFDQGDDIEDLLSFIEEFSKPDRIKVCVSSRPENYIVDRMSQYRNIRLQDLTANDMQICIRDELQRVLKRCPRASLSETDFDKVVDVMIRKADGVFLWVHYTLSSLFRGMRNEDDFDNLLDRIEELPDEMQQLYLQMWKRINKDENRYRKEATTYFSYMRFFPMSLFQMLVALNRPLQDIYLKSVKPQSPASIAPDCKSLESRISSRCAGLLELKIDHSPSEPWEEDLRSCSNRFADRKTPEEDNDLALYYKIKINFLHRTARDFLTNTKEGQALLGHPETTLDVRFQNVVRAQLATWIQGLRFVNGGRVWSLLFRVGRFATENEKELLLAVRRVCQRLCTSNRRIHHIGYKDFWVRQGIQAGDFEGVAAVFGCTDYVRYYVENARHHISAYYLGLLVLCTAIASDHRNENLSLVSWLVRKKADIWTQQVVQASLIPDLPAYVILCSLISDNVLQNEKLAKQAADIIQLILPQLLSTSRSNHPIHVSRDHSWLVADDSGRMGDCPGYKPSLVAQISPIKLALLVMQKFEQQAVFKPQWRYVIIQLLFFY